MLARLLRHLTLFGSFSNIFSYIVFEAKYSYFLSKHTAIHYRILMFSPLEISFAF